MCDAKAPNVSPSRRTVRKSLFFIWIQEEFMRIVAVLLLVALASLITACPAQPAAVGKLEITITGLSSNVAPAVTVTGPNNFSQVIAQPGKTITSIANLPVGSYGVVASDVTAGGIYTATVTDSPVTVAANATSSVSVVYAAAQ
jgi:hypothetical protein